MTEAKTMTEAETLKRWCPFARASDENQGTHNRTGGDFVHTLSPEGEKLYRDSLGNEGTVQRLMRLKSPTSKPFEPIGTYTPAAPVASCLCIAAACMAWRGLAEADQPSGYCTLMLQGVK